MKTQEILNYYEELYTINPQGFKNLFSQISHDGYITESFEGYFVKKPAFGNVGLTKNHVLAHCGIKPETFGVSIDVKDSLGETPLNYAIANNKHDIVKIIQQQLGFTNSDKTALHKNQELSASIKKAIEDREAIIKLAKNLDVPLTEIMFKERLEELDKIISQDNQIEVNGESLEQYSDFN